MGSDSDYEGFILISAPSDGSRNIPKWDKQQLEFLENSFPEVIEWFTRLFKRQAEKTEGRLWAMPSGEIMVSHINNDVCIICMVNCVGGSPDDGATVVALEKARNVVEQYHFDGSRIPSNVLHTDSSITSLVETIFEDCEVPTSVVVMMA